MPRFVRRYPLVKFIAFNVLAVLAYESLRPDPARAAVEPRAVVSTTTVQSIPTYIAHGDRDVGPSNAEPALAQHGF